MSLVYTRMTLFLQAILSSVCLTVTACSTRSSIVPDANHTLRTPSQPRMHSPLSIPSDARLTPQDATILASANANPKPETSGEKLRNDDSTVNMDRVIVNKPRLIGYVLVFDIFRNTLALRDGREAPPEAIATGHGIIWAEAGYWGAQIVAIDSVDVSNLDRREWHRMIFRGSDPVRLSIATRSKRIVIIDAFTGKVPRPF